MRPFALHYCLSLGVDTCHPHSSQMSLRYCSRYKGHQWTFVQTGSGLHAHRDIKLSMTSFGAPLQRLESIRLTNCLQGTDGERPDMRLVTERLRRVGSLTLWADWSALSRSEPLSNYTRLWWPYSNLAWDVTMVNSLAESCISSTQ